MTINTLNNQIAINQTTSLDATSSTPSLDRATFEASQRALCGALSLGASTGVMAHKKNLPAVQGELKIKTALDFHMASAALRVLGGAFSCVGSSEKMVQENKPLSSQTRLVDKLKSAKEVYKLIPSEKREIVEAAIHKTLELGRTEKLHLRRTYPVSEELSEQWLQEAESMIDDLLEDKLCDFFYLLSFNNPTENPCFNPDTSAIRREIDELHRRKTTHDQRPDLYAHEKTTGKTRMVQKGVLCAVQVLAHLALLLGIDASSAILPQTQGMNFSDQTAMTLQRVQQWLLPNRTNFPS